jgi:hypothetical protein
MKLTIEIECDNAAFYDSDGEANAYSRGFEVERILRDAWERDKFHLEPGDSFSLHDVNGNRVGCVKLEA